MKKIITLLSVLIACQAHASEYQVTIPSDSSATYTVLQKEAVGNFMTIVTKRDGKSGVSYSKRMYSCDNNTVKYLGTGDTLEQMDNSPPDESLSPIVPGSIADYIGKEACR